MPNGHAKTDARWCSHMQRYWLPMGFVPDIDLDPAETFDEENKKRKLSPEELAAFHLEKEKEYYEKEIREINWRCGICNRIYRFYGFPALERINGRELKR